MPNTPGETQLLNDLFRGQYRGLFGCFGAVPTPVLLLACVTVVEEMVALASFCFGIGQPRSAGLRLVPNALPPVHWPGCSFSRSISCPLRYGGSTRTQHSRTVHPSRHAAGDHV